MTSSPDAVRNWFDAGGKAYADFRPHYPAGLAAFLASISPDTRLAADVGCGNGQLTRLLAAHFDEVIGIDPSADQIANATPGAHIRYLCAPAEALPLPDHSVSLITVAQAAHWLDLPAFYQEARRVAAPAAKLALISYGTLVFEPALNDRFQAFYWNEIGPYWPAQRKLVDEGYATLAFPFEEIQAPALEIRVSWDLHAFLGYLSTWSAVRKAREAGHEDIAARFAHDLTQLWGDAHQARTIVWPLKMRLGQMG